MGGWGWCVPIKVASGCGKWKNSFQAFQSMDFDGLTQASFASGLALIAQL